MSNQAYTATDGRIEIAGVAVWLCAPHGPPLASERSASDVIGDAIGSSVRLVAVPVERLGPGFLTLGTRIAGEFIQKFVNYGFQIAFVGDVADAVAASDALRDFIRESNRGRHVWFVPDLPALQAKIAAAA